METEDVPEEYVDLLQTLIKMNVKPKGKNPQEIKAWMKAFVEQDSEDTDIHPDIKPVIHIQGATGPWHLKLRIFSGSSVSKPGKGEATYDMWRHEILCCMNQNVYSKDVILSAVHKSLSGEAARVIMLLGEHAELPQIIAKLDSIYGVIDDKTDVMTDFYNAKQMSDENVATWSCRLEEILGKAILIGKVKKAESDDMLHDKLWKGLKPELKHQCQYERENFKSFDELRIALRKLERDFQSDTTITPKQKQLSKQGVGLEQEQQDSELKGIIKQMSKMNTRLEMIEQGQQSRGRGTFRSREDQPKYRLQNSNDRNTRYQHPSPPSYRNPGQPPRIQSPNFRPRFQSSNFRPRFQSPNFRPRYNTPATYKPTTCYRCGWEGHMAIGCTAIVHKDGHPLN